MEYLGQPARAGGTAAGHTAAKAANRDARRADGRGEVDQVVEAFRGAGRDIGSVIQQVQVGGQACCPAPDGRRRQSVLRETGP